MPSSTFSASFSADTALCTSSMAPVLDESVSNGDCVASAYHSIRTRIIGHLSLADVNANEFLSDVTDGAIVRHASISVVVLQTSVKSTQALPKGFGRRRKRAHNLRIRELTGLGIVFHVGWRVVLSMFRCCLSRLSFKGKSESDGASSTRKVDDPLCSGCQTWQFWRFAEGRRE